MSKEEKGYLYQEYEPTPDKPCEIKGKSLLQNEELVIRSVPIKYVNDYVRLQNNWNKLKKWIKEYIEALENQADTIEGLALFEEHTLVILDDVSAVMQELETNNE